MKRILSTLLALCLLLGLTPAALGAEPAGETFRYTWSQEGDTHTVTRVNAQGEPVIEGGEAVFTYSGTSPWDTIVAIYEDAEVAHRVLSFVITLTTDVTLVGEPKGDSDVQAIAFQDGTVCWELNDHILTLQNLSLGAGTDNTTTFQNGTVTADSTANHNMLYAKNGGELILDSLTASRDDGGALASAIVDEGGGNSSVTIKDSTLTSGVKGMTTSLGNVLVVNGETASMILEDTAVTGLAPIYPTASVIGGSLTVDKNSTITATADGVAAAIVNGGELHLNGGTLVPGAGAYACGGRTNGTLHLAGDATVPTVELRDGDQIADVGYTGGTVALTCTGNQKVGDVMVTGCISEEAVNKFISSAKNQVGLTYMHEVGGDWTVEVSAAPEKADDYTLTQDVRGRYTVTGAYQDGGAYVVIHEAESFQTAISALFADVRGEGATINLGGDVTLVGDPKGDGTYPTTGVGEGWITWDLAGHTLTLRDICMLADYQGTLTVKNGTVKHDSISDKASPHGALFGAQMDGKLILEDVTATRADGGRLLGAYPANSYYPPYDVVTGAAITVTNCTLDNDREDSIKSQDGPGSNAITVGEGSAVSLVNTKVESGASWAVASVYGTLEVDDSSSITSTETTSFPTAAVSSVEGTVYLGGSAAARASVTGAALTGDVAMRDQGGSKFHLSGNATAATIEVAGPGVVDAAGYTGGNVILTYTGGDVLYGVPLVTGCASEEIAKKFTLTTGGGANVVYEKQADNTYGAVAAATPLSAEVTEFVQGTVYSISSKEEMEHLAALVNSGKSGMDCFFVLTDDVNLEGGEEHQWPSIGAKQGSTNIPFQGLFDGGGHTVSGLYINETDPSAMHGDKGLFAYVSPNGGVRNLTVVGQAGGGNYVGGVVSHNRGRVENCVSRVNIRGYSSLGGVISTNVGGAIVNCANYGTVTGVGAAGGVVSENSGGTILNCTNYGTVSGEGDAGGIVCYNTKEDNTAAAVTGCVNHGAVSGTTRVGGVVASNEGNSTVTGCVNEGPVTGGPGSTGGVAGLNEGTVTDCVNNGAVLATLSVGGIAGAGMPGSTIAGCQNNGAVTVHPETTSGAECGGVLGYSNGGLVENCVNRGAVTAQTAGTAEKIGGVVGAAGGGEINTCYNIGAVSCLGEEVGGIVGYTNSTAVTGCVSLGLSVKGSEQAGRIAGFASDGSTLSGNFARADMVLTGGAMTEETQKRDGIDGESITLTDDWQKTAFAGWDFDAVWNEGTGDSLPTLKALVEQTVTLPHPDPTPPPSGDSSGGSSSSKPTVEAGEGGTIKADSKGNVTITPDEGWRIASVTVNGKAVEIPADGVLTGLKSRDKVAVTFEKLPPEPVLTPDQFTDLDPDAWYYDAVTYVLANGLFRGTSENTFSPAAPMSRAMIFTVLHRMSGEAGEAVDGTPWYVPSLAWAVENGISDGSNPDGEITREQLVTMLYRYAKRLPGYTPEGSGAAASFSDYDAVSSYAEEAVQWALSQEVLAGKGNGILDPAGTATRAQVAVIVMRFIDKVRTERSSP